MKKVILFLILFINPVFVNSQELPLDCMEGIWKIYREDEIQSFSIKNNHNSLTLNYLPNGKEIMISEIVIGFLDYNPNESGKISYKDLKPKGDYYVELFKEDMNQDSVFTSSYFLTPDYDGCDDEGLYIQARHMIEYYRLDRLPSLAIRYLYQEEKKVERSYIAEYLNLKVAEVIVEKAVIYSSPNEPTNMYMVSGDVPTILKDKGDWLKIEYLGSRLVSGWILKSNVDL
jgi:hypothetical protein